MSSFCIKVFKLILFLQILLCWKWGKKNGRRQKVRTALPLDDIILAMYLQCGILCFSGGVMHLFPYRFQWRITP